MHKLLRPKLLLFFAILIMSCYQISDKAYAADDQSHHQSTSYVEMGQKALNSVILYCQHAWNNCMHYFYTLYQSYFGSSQNVKIQIAGKPKGPEVDENNGICSVEEMNDEQGDHCRPGDVVCKNNMDYFNTAYLAGDLIEDGAGSGKIDKFDDKFCGYAAAEKELLYNHTDALNDHIGVSNEDGDVFDNIKQHYDAIDYKELSGR